MKRLFGVIIFALCLVFMGIIFLLRCLIEIVVYGKKPVANKMNYGSLMDLVIDAGSFCMHLIYPDYKRKHYVKH